MFNQVDEVKALYVVKFDSSCSWRLFLYRLFFFCRGRKEYEPPRYMSVNTAVEQLLEIEENRQENGEFDSCVVCGLDVEVGRRCYIVVSNVDESPCF